LTSTKFPDSLKLPALVTLELTNLIFRDSENVGYVEPFSFFTKLNSLILRGCAAAHAKMLTISSLSLINLSINNNYPDIESLTITASALKVAQFFNFFTFLYFFILSLKFGKNQLTCIKLSHAILLRFSHKILIY